jgi:hypothetical protein
VPELLAYVGYRGKTGQHMLDARFRILTLISRIRLTRPNSSETEIAPLTALPPCALLSSFQQEENHGHTLEKNFC